MRKVEGGQIDLFRVEVTWSVMGKQYQKNGVSVVLAHVEKEKIQIGPKNNLRCAFEVSEKTRNLTSCL